MKKEARWILVALLACAALAPAVVAEDAPPAAEAPAAPAAGLAAVESKFVCMVNNQVFAEEQIPVVVQDKTYYGCCEMCKGRLAEDPSSRTAVDPVSGATVDKATAVIGALPNRKVFYFENEANLATYRDQLAKGE